MPGYRKLGKPSDQRQALLRGQVTSLLNNGSIETTVTRGKEIRSIAEKLITLAIAECENDATRTVTTQNEKAQSVERTFTVDAPSKLAARRKMMSYLYNVPATRLEKEKDDDYKDRAKEINYPVVEKLFREIGPKYKKRNDEGTARGGYTRILKMGPRRGDAAEMVRVELI